MTEQEYAERFGAEIPDLESRGICGQCGEELPGDVGDWGTCFNRCPVCGWHMALMERAKDIWYCRRCFTSYIFDKDKQEFRLIPQTHADADQMGQAESLIESKEENK